MRTASALLLAASAATLANAHFTLDSPKSFGFDEDKEGTVPCGGYSIAGATRSPWYYKGGPVQIDSHHDTATVNIRISYAANPTTAADFTAVPALKENLALKGEGEFCFHVDASAVAPPAGTTVAAGTNATLLVEFISTVHGALYQCAAVQFVDTAAQGAGASLTCTDSLIASDDNHDDGDHDDDDGHNHGSNATSTSTSPSPSGAGSGSSASAPTGTSAPAGAGVQRASVLGAGAVITLLAAAGIAVLL